MLEWLVPLLFVLGPGTPPAKVPPRGVIVQRESQPVFVAPDGKSGARILLDETTAPGLKEAAMSELLLLPGATVPEHTHDTSGELVYILEGHGQMTIDGQPREVRAGMAIFIPAGVKHSVVADTKVEPLRALQVYTPGGPEQRFRSNQPAKE